MASEINAQRVERRLDRLLAEYGDVPVEEQTWEGSDEEFEGFADSARDGYLGGAYAWVVREPADAPPLTESMPEEANGDARRALMIRNRADEGWSLPGGGREDDETFEAAARREVREETGVDCSVGEPFLLRRVTAVPDDGVEGASADAVHLLYAFFDATYEGGSIAIQPAELHGAAWFADPPERLLPATERRAEAWNPDAGAAPRE